MAREEWRQASIPNCRHVYFVSSLGRIKRAATSIRQWNALTRRHNVKVLPERVLAQQLNGRGYKIVSLQLGHGNAKRTVAVAPLVCAAFHGPKPNNTMHCAHLNGNSLDNRPENLVWAEPIENEAHKALHGTKMLGERHHRAQLTPDDVRAIRSEYDPTQRGICQRLSTRFGVSTTQVCDIANRKSWAHVT